MGNLLYRRSPHQVTVTRAGVAAFRKCWPSCNIPQHRPVNFTFDRHGTCLECDLPPHGVNTHALAALMTDAYEYLSRGQVAAWADEDFVTEQKVLPLVPPQVATLASLPVTPKLKLYYFRPNRYPGDGQPLFDALVQAVDVRQARDLWTDWALSASFGFNLILRDYDCLLVKPDDSVGPTVLSHPKFMEEVRIW